jgi:hypothetical protein
MDFSNHLNRADNRVHQVHPPSNLFTRVHIMSVGYRTPWLQQPLGLDSHSCAADTPTNLLTHVRHVCSPLSYHTLSSLQAQC